MAEPPVQDAESLMDAVRAYGAHESLIAFTAGYRLGAWLMMELFL